MLTVIQEGKQAEECIPADAVPAGAWECELWSRLYGSPSISRKATVYSTPVTDVSLFSLPTEACSAFYRRRDAQQAQTWMRRITEHVVGLQKICKQAAHQGANAIWDSCTSIDVVHHIGLLPGVETHTWGLRGLL